MSQHTFRCRTVEAFKKKILIDILTSSLRTAYFKVSRNGIDMRAIDDNHNKAFVIHEDVENFTIYKFRPDIEENYDNECELDIGVTLSHFHKILKSIKKKDILELFIKKDSPCDLGIKTIPNMSDNLRTTTSYITIQNFPNLDIELPTGYKKHLLIQSTEFQKMCKEIRNIGSNTVKVMSKAFFISFSCDADNVLKREVEFGDKDESDDEDTEIYSQTFSIEDFLSIQKIAGICDDIQIFPMTGLPLLFKANIGIKSYISIYIWSNELKRELEKSSNTDDCDSDNG